MEEKSLVEQNRQSVRSVERALDILLTFSGADDHLRLSDIATRVGLHKSTVYRLLSALESRGFVRRDKASDRYQLGWSILELTSHAYRSNDISTIALPEMTRLRDDIGETVSLYIRSENERIRIQAVESTKPVRRVANIGMRFPLYVGASGKVLLAYSSEFAQGLLKDIVSFSDDHHYIEFMQQLQMIQSQGYALSIEEREVGAAAVAAPVFGRDKKLVAALSVSGPVDRYKTAQVEEFADACKQSAGNISVLLAL